MDMRGSFIKGIIPEGFRAIDAHAHMGGSYSTIFLKKYTVEDSINFSKSLGIDKICISSLESLCGDLIKGNREMFALIEQYPENLYGYAVYNPRHPADSIQDIEKYICHPNFVGVKIHPREHDYPLTGENYMPLWQYAEDKDFLILCHTWETESHNNPGLFFPILEKYSGMKVLLGHSGGTYKGYEMCYRLLGEYPKVYMDLNGFLYSNKWIEQVVEETDENRLVFSTDQVFNDPRISLGRIVLSKLSDKQKEKILYGNFCRLLTKNCVNGGKYIEYDLLHKQY